MSQETITSPPSAARVLLTFFLPIAGAVIFSLLASGGVQLSTGDQGSNALLFAGLGLTSWFVGWRWYGLSGLGLRGGRPITASIGFATLVWLAFLIVRFLTVAVAAYGTPDGGRTFIYTLLFEAFCTQLWVYGLFFRSVADWRGPLTAAISSGILFGAAAFLLFQESFASLASSLLYFVIWGITYGIIRLRTGSLLGSAIVQALQIWTGWYVLAPTDPISTSQLRNMYLIASVVYLVIVWRLWPKEESDYRV
jgi:Type II CAAX prenyl endopeptidase Rce1-like